MSRKAREISQGMFFSAENDPDLKLLIERWPKLFVELRQVIVKIVG